MTTKRTGTVKPLNHRQRIAVLNCAIEAVANMHGSVTGEDHGADASGCTCQYGETIRGLKSMRRESYGAVQKLQKAKLR